MAMSPRTVPRSVAAVLEALELDQPTLVTLSRLEEMVAETGSPASATHAARLLRERGWLLPLRTPGVWEFAPGARAGARGAGDPFVEVRARMATQPIEAAVAAESAAWLHGLSSRPPDPHVLALPPGVHLPKSLDGFRVVRWAAADALADSDGLPLWSATTLLAFMGARPHRYRDWPNVSEWLAEAAQRVSLSGLGEELAREGRSAWARTGYLLSRGGREQLADELLSAAPAGSGPFHLGRRAMPSQYAARFEVIDHVFPTWWSVKAAQADR